ncbi:MAG: GNAT family N-acetyltransferase [Microbacteriaceae bacterium]|nr:GNAT family N-acetyltransferase [Microbacteriaceae bacterium]
MRLRDLTALDVPSMLALNNDAVPAVPASTEVELAELLRMSSFGFAAVSGEEFLGFVVGFEPGLDYASPNYRFFENRGTDHLYVDRIVVAEAARGMRVGQTLYNRVVDLAVDQGRAEVTCEVNIEPPNPASLAFHSRLGFSEVDRQDTGYATVTLLARRLS